METDVGGRMDSIIFGMLKKLNKKIDTIGNIPDGKIAEAVNTYLEENPVQPVDIATVQEISEYLGMQ